MPFIFNLLGRFVALLDKTSPTTGDNMDDNEMDLLESVVPGLIGEFLQRFDILKSIDLLAPVGRRVLSEHLHLSERVLRSQTDVLKTQGLLTSSQAGMMLSDEGRRVMNGLEPVANRFLGLTSQEKLLAERLDIERCFIVRGDRADGDAVTKQLGTILNDALAKLLPEGNNTIVVMGGSTMASVAMQLSPELSNNRKLTFVPGRGGIGESVDKQANSVAALMAKRTRGEAKSLYIPEQLSESTYHPLLNEPTVKPVLDLISHAGVAIHGIGKAGDMARRRGVNEEILSYLRKAKAVGEAFGSFYNREGRILYQVHRIGLQLNDVQHFNHVFAVASGHDKAQAIESYMKIAPHQTILITDEGAANVILKK